MTKYNTPADSNLIGILSSIRARLDRLENRRNPSSTSVISPIKASDYAAAVTVTSTTYTDTFVFPGIFIASTPVVYIVAWCSDSTTAGDFRLTDENSVPLTNVDGLDVAPTVIPLGTVAQTSFSSAQDDDYSDSLPLGTDRTIKLQVRRTAGAGTISVKARYLTQVPQ